MLGRGVRSPVLTPATRSLLSVGPVMSLVVAWVPGGVALSGGGSEGVDCHSQSTGELDLPVTGKTSNH